VLTALQDRTETDRIAKLTAKQEKTILCVLSSRSVVEGLKQAKVSRSRWYEWLSDPAFKAAYEKRRESLLDDAMHALRTSLTRAVKVLDELMTQASAHPATKLRAALSVIELVIQADVNADILKRLEALEAHTKKKVKG